MKSASTPGIAVIGAGAIADIFHLPALARRPELRERVIIVDRDGERARTAAAKYQVARWGTDYREILKDVQAAIVAVPHRLHVPVSRDCLAAGVHVLCEKPLAETAAEAQALAQDAEKAGVLICVNNTRRLYPSAQAIAALVARGTYGPITQIDFEEGGKFEWPAVGDGYFGVKAGGRGVLADVGAHVVDLVCWWLGGEPQVAEYRDDSMGGTEAVCELHLALGGATARIRLSWLAKLRNSYRVRFTSGDMIEHGIYDWRNPALIDPRGRRSTLRTAPGPATYPGFADVLIDNFLIAISGGAPPLVPAAATVPALSVIERCYANRTPFDMPWLDPPETVPR